MLSKLEYFNKLEEAMKNNPINDFWSRFENGLKGILPQPKQPETNPIEQEIQGLKDKNYSYEDVNSAIDIDESIQDKVSAKDFASKIYGMAKQGFQKFKDISGGTENERIISKMTSGEKLTPDEIAHIGTGADFTTGLKSIESGIVKKVAPKVFQGFKDLTTKVLERLKGKSVASKQEILDFTNMPELKQAERDLVRSVVNEYKEAKIPVQEFANKVKTELLPLEVKSSDTAKIIKPKDRTINIGGQTHTLRGGVSVMERQGSFSPKYENVVLPSELRGPVADYEEIIFRSPIKTSAGSVHGFDVDDYFAHARVEKMAPSYMPGKKVFRDIEWQSDLFQKGRLEGEAGPHTSAQLAEDLRYYSNEGKLPPHLQSIEEQDRFLKAVKKEHADSLIREAELSKLEPYRNTWHERMARERIKAVAEQGGDILLVPTGETAMKIEGLGDKERWIFPEGRGQYGERVGRDVQIQDLKQGVEVNDGNSNWIITDVLGDGKFKAVLADLMKRFPDRQGYTEQQFNQIHSEVFDISGKVDTNNPIYRFYEKEVGRYLTNKYGAKLITDPQGVKWMEVNIKPEMKRLPIEAFGILPFIPQIFKDKEE